MKKKRIPYVAVGIAAVNILYFLYLLLTDAVNSSAGMAAKGALCIIEGRYQGNWQQLFISLFMHFDIRHLGGNLLMLLVVGELLEERLGSLRTLFIYFLSGLAGSAATIFWYWLRGATIISAGASGAVYGLIGALFCLISRARESAPGFSRRRMLIMVFLMLYSGFANSGINIAAHIGGFAAGIVGGRLFLNTWKFGH